MDSSEFIHFDIEDYKRQLEFEERFIINYFFESDTPKKSRKLHNKNFNFQPYKQRPSTSQNVRRASIKRPPTPDVDDEEQDREPTLQEIINIKLIESGEKDRLQELLRERLIECGWRDEMKALCRSFTRKKGRENVTVADLIHLITPKGRATVPDSVKAELLQRIRSFLQSAAL